MKKIREEVDIKGSGRVTDLVDDMIKQAYNITDDEYDYIAGETSDEDLRFSWMDLGILKPHLHSLKNVELWRFEINI